MANVMGVLVGVCRMTRQYHLYWFELLHARSTGICVCWHQLSGYHWFVVQNISLGYS